MHIAANDDAFTLLDVLWVLVWVPNIEKNLLSVSSIAQEGLMVRFFNDRCTTHDINDGDTIVGHGFRNCMP